jgi:hypothetical protein
MTDARATLDAMLDIAEAAIRDAQAFEHEHGLASIRTRKLPGDMLRTFRRWRSENGAARVQPQGALVGRAIGHRP